MLSQIGNSTKLYIMKISIVLVFSGILALFAQAVQGVPLANAKILNLSGTVTVHQGEDVASAKALKVGAIIKQGDVVSTGSQSTVKIAFSNGSVIDLDPNSQVELEVVSQKPYRGQKTYQHWDRDPSQSITLLNLNYGSLLGHVKKLTDASKFNVKTPLGVTVVRGTRFRVAFNYDSLSNHFRFVSQNIDGIVDVITDTEGQDIDYGTQNNVNLRLATAGDASTVMIAVPPAHVVSVTLPLDDPMAKQIVDLEKNIAPGATDGILPLPPIFPPKTEDDSEIVSPSGAA